MKEGGNQAGIGIKSEEKSISEMSKWHRIRKASASAISVSAAAARNISSAGMIIYRNVI